MSGVRGKAVRTVNGTTGHRSIQPLTVSRIGTVAIWILLDARAMPANRGRLLGARDNWELGFGDGLSLSLSLSPL